MYQLSIDHQGRSVTTTDHPDRDDAHRSLINYVIGADYYLRPLPTHPDTTRAAPLPTVMLAKATNRLE